MDNLLNWLQEIYANDFCDGSWEHVHGLTITTLDNPGWDFKFDILNTDIEHIPFTEVFIKRSEVDWYHCRIRGGIFEGWGGAKNLTEIISTFKEWYENAVSVVEVEESDK